MPPSLTFRPLHSEDLPALHQLLSLGAHTDGHDRLDSLEDMQTQFDDPWSNPATDSQVGFTPTGDLVTFARCFTPTDPVTEIAVNLWWEIHPAHRSPQLTATVFNWLAARAANCARACAPARTDLPRSLRVGIPDHLTDKLTLLEQQGFAPARYFYRMRRDLRDPIPAGPLPSELRLVTYTPELDHAMYTVYQESFRDHWGFQPETPAEWEQFYTSRAAFRPDLSLLVMDGPQAVGISFNTVDPDENARTGLNEGWVAELGVLRSHRKRGLATALLCETMRRFQAAGLTHATLGVDSENPTGALGVYESVGFQVVRRMIAMDKAV